MRFQRQGPFHWVAETGYTVCVTLSGPDVVWSAWAPTPAGQPGYTAECLGCCPSRAMAERLCAEHRAAVGPGDA